MAASDPVARRFFVPEVVQTSPMDCGPAVLKCALEGFGIPVHYGRLREACQTDVDGTSIDVLENVANQLGLDAEQLMLPVDHILLPEARVIPAIIVVTLPSGFTHFVLLWRRHGPWLQVMDPAVGRRWVRARPFLEEVYLHSHEVPVTAWHEWARSEDFQQQLRSRMKRLKVGGAVRAMTNAAAAATDWQMLARLDAAARFGETLVRSGGIRRGREARRFLSGFVGTATCPAKSTLAIPATYWSVRAVEESKEHVRMSGAVLVRIRRRATPGAQRDFAPTGLSPELAAARAEPAMSPGRTLLNLMRGRAGSSLLPLVLAMLLAAAGGVIEVVLLRSALGIGRDLTIAHQRLQAIAIFMMVASVVTLLELKVAGSLNALGRFLETRFRMAFLEKIPRLNDRYFASRPTSDMAERGHAIHMLRMLPRLSGSLVRTAFVLFLTAGAISWVDPPSAVLAFAAAATAMALPLLFNRLLAEMDLRARTHGGALSRFYLDAQLGLSAVRAHGAERAVRREHETLLSEWVRANLRLLRWAVAVEGMQVICGFGLAGWLLLLHANRLTDAGGALLLAYWALSLPMLGEGVVLLARQYPAQRNVVLRLLEPLGALDSEPTASNPLEKGVATSTRKGVTVTFEDVGVVASGHKILEGITAHIAAGEHVAVIGESGAGKSTLVGLLLGWHRATEGHVLIDGQRLDAHRLDGLRPLTAWVDPAVQIWNRPLAHNLFYGVDRTREGALGKVLESADLLGVLQRLPDGLQTPLGEGGGLLSGGEGQRVRLGRALLRRHARLVILDEPFRGLDRPKRTQLLKRLRRIWRNATLLCITHDVGDTLDFERVLVVSAGHVVEDGKPSRLAEMPDSNYRKLLAAEVSVRKGLWSATEWRRLWLESGRLRETRT